VTPKCSISSTRAGYCGRLTARRPREADELTTAHLGPAAAAGVHRDRAMQAATERHSARRAFRRVATAEGLTPTALPRSYSVDLRGTVDHVAADPKRNWNA
jgi:hypothetical protein